MELRRREANPNRLANSRDRDFKVGRGGGFGRLGIGYEIKIAIWGEERRGVNSDCVRGRREWRLWRRVSALDLDELVDEKCRLG